MKVTAITTYYLDIPFRSRLEAKWAVFFQNLGIKWKYEKEGYNLDGIVDYLPDFWFPDQTPEGKKNDWGLYAEIKPVEPNEVEIWKMKALVKGTKNNGFIFEGEPYPGEYKITKYWNTENGDMRSALNVRFEARGNKILIANGKFTCDPTVIVKGNAKEFLDKAFLAARSARFEHGETPKGNNHDLRGHRQRNVGA